MVEVVIKKKKLHFIWLRIQTFLITITSKKLKLSIIMMYIQH